MNLIEDIVKITKYTESMKIITKNVECFGPIMSTDKFWNETLWWSIFLLKQRFTRETLKISHL
jgi:hypothetical protein